MIMAERSLSGIAGGWALPEGTKLDNGNITIRGVLGEGGFGVTYRADDLFFGEIALKEFLPKSMVMRRSDRPGSYDVVVKPEKTAAYNKSMRQFWREPRIISSLKHPNIVEVLFDFQENNTAYYGMRLLKGMELAKWLQKRGKPLDYKTASEIMFPVMDALIYMHQKGTYHRDISPSNIFLEEADGGWRPVLVDFGAAYTAQKDFTHTFNRVYNKNFSPPEQNWDGDYQGPHSDVYAFCATFYYVMTGIVPLPPIERGTDEADRLKPLIDVIPEGMPPISRKVSDAIMNGLKLNPRTRTQEMRQLKQALIGTGTEYIDLPLEDDTKGGTVDISKGFTSSEDITSKVEPRKASILPLLGLLLDWALAWVVYFLLKSAGLSQGISVLVSAILFLIVNGLLAGSGGTAGQRIVGYPIRLKTKECGFLYAFVRLLAPLSLVDEAVACGKRGFHPITNGLFAPDSMAKDEDDGEGKTIVLHSKDRDRVHARLVCVAGEYIGRAIELDAPQMFGRLKPSTLIFQDSHISSHHCMLRRMSEKTWHVIDMKSKNGTYLNGKRLPSGVASDALKPGDRLALCKEEFIYEEGHV